MRHAAVIGATRGLGLEFARQLRDAGCATVATYRGAPAALSGVDWRPLDLDDPDSIDAFGRDWGDSALDLLVLNAGLTDRPSVLGELDYAAWERVLRVNVVAAVRAVDRLRGPLARSAGARVVALSSELASIGPLHVGSSSWQRRGAYYAYRTSKAALNAAIKLLALELADDGVLTVAVDPGWVRTAMGGVEAPLSPETAVAQVLRLVDHLTPSDSGAFLRADGTPLER